METTIAKTDTPEQRAQTVARAVELLARGEVVALPTETVYGLAADATRADAVLKIFEAKERPFFDPLIVHLPDFKWLERVAAANDPLVKQLIETFWPGPLTLVLPRREIVPDVVTSGLPTVAVRMSAHPIFHEVVERFGKPLAAPSANRFGRISPTTAEHVSAELNGRIPLIVDGGATSFGVESTIVSIGENEIQILRSGPVTPEDFEPFGDVRFPGMEEKSPQAPGRLKSHYAPRTPLLLQSGEAIGPNACVLESRFVPQDGGLVQLGLLAWRSAPLKHDFSRIEILSPTGDLREAAATLFAKMRRLDEAGLDVIFAQPVPESGLGIAIMDRLRKAASR